MNKQELIKAVAEQVGMTQKATKEVVDTTLELIADTLVAGEDVKLTGFGNFTVVERAEREGRNPQTGETIVIAASKAPKFKASKTLKDAVKEA